MKLRIFESDMGDCLLLEAKSKHLVLCDGGMKASMEGQVRAELSKLRADNKELDLIYISHIDNDHVTGILQLLLDETEWRVFDHHAGGNDPVRKPDVPRPPKIKGILHNAFRDQVSSNRKAIENQLVAAAPALFATAIPAFIGAAEEMQGIASGIPEALKISRLTKVDALNIPVNKPPGVTEPTKLLLAGQPGDEFELGTMKFTLIGPTRKELLSLRKGWNTWLRESPDRVKEIRDELKKRIEDFSNGLLSGTPYDLRDWNGIPDIKGVTAPNVATLMFMVEENGKTLLLTGDAQQDFIFDGLERTGFLSNGSVHLDVLKVQHHGSEHNMDENFARKVSADHYVFCGNGSHGNPEIKVLDMIFESRVGEQGVRSLAAKGANRDFHFWFSTTSAAARNGLVHKKIFAEVEKHVKGLRQRSGGRLTLHFNQGAFIDLDI